MDKSPVLRVAAIGECMVELQERADGSVSQAFGGDTLNTAVYMARLGQRLGRFVHYVSAIGDDPFSSAMAEFWRAQGVDDSLTMRRTGRRPGLYFIKTDAAGERRFFYWRGEAAVREAFECEGSDALLESLASFDAIYLSGISLAVLRPASRERLLVRLADLAAAGKTIDFDCNYRPLLWEDVATTRAVYERVFGFARRVLVTVEELEVLGVAPHPAAGAAHFRPLTQLEVVIKDGAKPCTLIHGGQVESVAATCIPQVVDTTAAGDSFSGAYLLGRMLGLAPAESARRAHRVAGAVVQHRGAIIPAEATPDVYATETAADRP
ncbi:sugar kinase [Rubrivivax benzoatilyticus]|uniref:Sugar kinase n=1 Tax=Rubrivivax benzoatilyticus TaxID=316997 RepID=A0ABX0HTT1_9BURK|nr:sugar kinase [Rubrivivax benzoatilyticus]EGJ08937.1 2-dehydro-3-deoxygluconokinase [Rubrivivax benzoatilyticus JA2 = ATCC BAA-35]NHK96765.1 sugar kinase [Rubrivivax benzoatilyticus]NHL24480.1 sugar kinase [Rubrivivax benzoatilyticus]